MAQRHWMLALALLALALGSAYRPPPSAAASVEGRETGALLEDARQHLDAGAYAIGAQVLRRALLRDPGDSEAAALLREAYEHGGLSIEPDEEMVEVLERALGPGFRRTETRRFVVLSDADIAWTRVRERLLERTYHEVTRFAERLGLPVAPPEHKMTVVLFGDHASYRAFALEHDGVQASWVAGYYAAVPNHAVFYDDRTSPAFLEAHERLDEAHQEALLRAGTHPSPETKRIDDAVREERERLHEQAAQVSLAKTTHEAAHLVAFNTNIQLRSRHYPFWITEGLAIAFESADPDRPFGPGRHDADRREDFDALLSEGEDALIPLIDFVAHTEVPAQEAVGVRKAYTQAWGLFTDAARYEREALAGLLIDIARTPGGMMSADVHRTMFEARFADAERHERAWLRRCR